MTFDKSEVQHERVGHRHDDAGGQVFAGRRQSLWCADMAGNVWEWCSSQ